MADRPALELGRTALYRRVSTDMQVEKDASLPEQRALQLEYASRHGALVLAEFEDGDRTGTNDDREQFQLMIAAAKRREFDTILIYKSERAFRNRDQAAIYRVMLRKVGVTVRSVTESWVGGTEPAEKAMEGIVEVMNEFAADNTRVESKRGVKGVARNKHRQFGQPPYGYDWKDRSEVGAGWVVNDTEAPVVRLIFEKFIEGAAQSHIVTYLNEAGIPPPGASPARWVKTPTRPTKWAYSTIAQILSSRVYIGEVRFTDHPFSQKRGDRPSPYKAPPPLWFPGAHPPIVAAETFDAAQALRKVRPYGRGAASEALFVGGVLLCPHCNAAGLKNALEVKRSVSGGRTYYSYACGYRMRQMRDERHGRPVIGFRCPGMCISETKVRALLTSQLKRWRRTPPNRIPRKVAPAATVHVTAEEETIRQVLDSLPRQEANAKDLMVAGLYTMAQLRGKLAEIVARRADLTRRLADAANRPAPAITAADIETLLDALADGPGPMSKRRDMLVSVIAHIVPAPDRKSLALVLA